MALGAQIVDLVRLQLVEEFHKRHGISEISVVKEKPGLVKMRVSIDVVDAPGIEGRGAADDAMDFVAFAEKQLRQIGAVLSCNAGNECAFHS